MFQEKDSPPSMTDRGLRVALIFALAAERLSAYYEHQQWLTEAQGASLAADWLRRSKLTIEFKERRQLSALSDQAGLYTAHEMMESLDPNYHSELAETLMMECEKLLDDGLAG